MIPVDRMRQLDRWLGVPMCWLATLVRRRTRSGQPRQTQRVVFLQLAESGSNVLADPALRSWIERGHEAPGFVTFAANRASLRITGSIDDANVFVLDPRSLATLVRDVWRLRRWLRARRVDTLVDLELFTRFSALLCLLSGVRRRVGFHAPGVPGLYRGNLYTDPVRYDPDIHVARNYLALLGPLGASPAGKGLPVVVRRRPGRAEQARVDAMLERLFGRLPGRLVLVNANASDLLPQRRWPVERFQAFVERLLAHEPEVRVLLTGAADDASTTRALATRVDDPRCVDGAGQCALGDLPALFERAALLLTNDSGPAHFAAVSAVPVIVMFGPETPLRFAPLGNANVMYAGLGCSPCVSPANQRRSRCTDNRCLQAIQVEQVLDRALAILHGRPPEEPPLPVAGAEPVAETAELAG